MKNLLLIILSILSLSVFGQVQDSSFLTGKAQFSQSGAGAGYWQVSGTFTDESGLYDAGFIQVGDVLFFSDAGVGYHLPITQVVSATPPSFVIRVNNSGITNIISVPTTSGVIYRPSTGEYLSFASGISNPDQQTYQSYLTKKLDAIATGSVNTIYNSSDSLQNENHLVKMAADGSQTFGIGHWPSFPDRDYDFTTEYGLLINRGYGEITLANKGNYISLYGSKASIASARTSPDSYDISVLDLNRFSHSATIRVGRSSSPNNFNSINIDTSNISFIDRVSSVDYSYKFPLPSVSRPSTTPNTVNVLKWTAGTPTFGEITNDYEVTITGGNTGSKLYVRSDVTGVTASFASNQLTITIPGNGKIHSADWRLVASDVQASADGGGVTNWVKVRFVNTSHNTSIDDMRCPDVQKVAIPTSGALSETNAATYDIDSNPAPSVIAVGGNAITLRIGGLSVGGQGYNLKFSGI